MISAIVKNVSPKKPSPLRRVLDARDFQIMIPLNFAVDPIFKLDEEGEEDDGEDDDDDYDYDYDCDDEEAENEDEHEHEHEHEVITNYRERDLGWSRWSAQRCMASKGEEDSSRDTCSGNNQSNALSDGGNEGSNDSTGDGHADGFACSDHGHREGGGSNKGRD